MGRSNALILALAMVGLASTTTAGIVAVAWRNRTAVPAQPVARLPGKGKPAPVAPGAAAPFSTVRGPSIAEKINEAMNKPAESEADIAIRITKSRWWRKPPTMSELAAFIDSVAGTEKGTRTWVDRDFNHDAGNQTGLTEAAGQASSTMMTSPQIYVTQISQGHSSRLLILTLMAKALEMAESRDGPAR